MDHKDSASHMAMLARSRSMKGSSYHVRKEEHQKRASQFSFYLALQDFHKLLQETPDLIMIATGLVKGLLSISYILILLILILYMYVDRQAFLAKIRPY